MEKLTVIFETVMRCAFFWVEKLNDVVVEMGMCLTGAILSLMLWTPYGIAFSCLILLTPLACCSLVMLQSLLEEYRMYCILHSSYYWKNPKDWCFR